LWWAAVPKKRWPDDDEWRRMLETNWHRLWGDRRQELVFIGTSLDEAGIRRTLDACLIKPAQTDRLNLDRYRDLPDPFPIWRRKEPA
jgi:hypothetical protein